MSYQHQNNTGISAVKTSFKIIEYLIDSDGAGVTEVAEKMSISKSTAHEHMITLLQLGYLVRDGDTFKIGLEFLRIGRHTQRTSEVYSVSDPVIKRIADDTGMAVWVSVEERHQAVYINKALGDRAIPSRGKIGARVPLHSAAVGKAILAQMTDEQISKIANQFGLPSFTENTITDPQQLLDELNDVRARGVAFNDGESLKGVRGVACPIVVNGATVGSVGIVGTDSQLSGDQYRQHIPEIMKAGANEISINITYAE